MSIKAIFYSKFDPHEGPKVIHQVPEESVITPTDKELGPTSSVPSSTATVSPPLLSFPAISRFIIPRQSLCGNLITLRPPRVTPQTPECLLLSYPICIRSAHYARNEFIFAFTIVLSPPEDVDVPAYTSVITKLAHLMRSLEIQSHFLSLDNSSSNTGPIYSLCETLMEDLNNYCECMIPIDDLNTLNIKLFPTYPNPPSVKPWHVPLLTVRISTLMDENWDLTMQRVIPFINGVNSVMKIALLADADLKLTKKAVKHLLYYGCALLLDIFSFNAIYAPTAEFEETIVKDLDMQKECARYVNLAFAPHKSRRRHKGIIPSMEAASSLPSATGRNDSLSQPIAMPRDGLGSDSIWPLTSKGDIVDGVGMVQLFANLRQGLTVREWYALNRNMLANIDMRRFITFGVIKGFLYRIHRYPFAVGTKKNIIMRNGSKGDTRSAPLHLGETVGLTDRSVHWNQKEDPERTAFVDRVKGLIDGTHCFDEICTELGIPEKDLEEQLRQWYPEEVVVICK